jgi:hypothetical protein
MGVERPLIIDAKAAGSRQPIILEKYDIPEQFKLEVQQ